MSDIKNDKTLQLLLEGIASKVNTLGSKPVLNGGFDRLMVVVEHIQKKQEETGDQVAKIHEGLYDPADGLYARVKMVETATKQFAERQSQHLISDERNMSEISAGLKKLTEADDELEEKSKITQKLKTIAGDDLKKLEEVIVTKTWWSEAKSKAVWIIVAAGAGAGFKVLFDLLVHR